MARPGNESQASSHHRNVIIDELEGGAQLYESAAYGSVIGAEVGTT